MRKLLPSLCLLTLIGVSAAASAASAAEAPVVIPAPAVDTPKSAGPTRTAVLAGGCFWGVQGVLQHLHGVKQVLSGYSGGDRSTAEYKIVSTGSTEHAESVQVEYDPKVVSYGQILQVFFSVAHDPTQLDRQGPDHGTQYRSAIFYADAQQEKVARAYIAQLDAAKVYPKPIVTRVTPLRAFYPAEKYHQDFLLNNPDHPYIVINDLPKVRAFQHLLPALYQPKALATDGSLR